MKTKEIKEGFTVKELKEAVHRAKSKQFARKIKEMEQNTESATIPPLLAKAKRRDNSKWVEGFYYEDMDIPIILEYIEDGGNIIDVHHEIIPETLCWHFGKTDKNGKKLFTGDLIENMEIGVAAEIYWDSDVASVLYRNPKTKGLILVYTNELSKNFVKIGNIHDNKNIGG